MFYIKNIYFIVKYYTPKFAKKSTGAVGGEGLLLAVFGETPVDFTEIVAEFFSDKFKLEFEVCVAIII